MENDIYYSAITIGNIKSVYKKVRRTCKNKAKVKRFDLFCTGNIYQIYYHLLNETYRPLKYTMFLIYDPKIRLVMSQEISDKIVNHFVANFYLLPLLEKKLIDSNVATRKNKGTKQSDELVKKYINILNMKNDKVYVLKLDIKKYFYSIDINILKDMLKKDIKSNKILDLIFNIIDETGKEYVSNRVRELNDKYDLGIPVYSKNNGLSIGAETSQFLAIYYLNGLDHHIKEELHAKFYVRYMDDLIIFSEDKDKLIYYWNMIDKYLESINLKLNKKSNIYNLSNGFNFLGINYRIINNKFKIKPSKQTYKKFKYNIGHKDNIFDYYKSLASYKGYFDRINYKIGKINMNIDEKVKELEDKYKDTIIMILNEGYYEVYNNNGRIMHLLMEYKFIKNKSSFPLKSLYKVIDKLNLFRINYCYYDNGKEKYKCFDNNNYSMYHDIAIREEDIENDKRKIYDYIDIVLRDYPEKKDNLIEYLKKIIIK